MSPWQLCAKITASFPEKEAVAGAARLGMVGPRALRP